MDQDTSHSAGSRVADRGTLAAFVLMVVLAGGNAVAVRMSNSALPPFWGAALRSGVAALVFWVIVVLRHIALPRGRALVGALFYGFLAVGVAYAFLYWGLLRLPASLAAPILALAPLMTFFFAWAHGLEEFRWRGVAGALVATAGVSLGLAGGFGRAVHVPSVLALVAGVASLAEGAVVFKLFPKSDPLVSNALAFTTGTPLLVLVSWLAGEQWSLPNTASTWAAFAYLALIGSVVVFYLYLHILSRWTASATSYSFLLMPVATVVIAAWLLREVVTTSFVVGAMLAVAGVWIGAIKSSPKTVELTCSPTASKAIC
jgi:drug/metabolite transporter (DMT)-like permease